MLHLETREIGHAAFAIGDPRGVDELVALLVEKLVSGANRAVADTAHGANVLCVLGLAKQVAGHVDAGGGDRERGATGEILDRRHVLGQTGRDLDELLFVEAQLIAKPRAEVRG